MASLPLTTPSAVSSVAFLSSSSAAASANMSSSAFSIPFHLVTAIPRLMYRGASFAVVDVPLHIAGLVSGAGRSVIAEATTEGVTWASGPALPQNGAMTTSAGAAGGVAAVVSAAASASAAAPLPRAASFTVSAEAEGQSYSLGSLLGFTNTRDLGGLLNYVTSKWAVSCLAVALVLNRTQIYAAPRRQTALRWPWRLALRLLPIVLLLVQIKRLLQAMRCQTWPQSPKYRSYHPAFSSYPSWAGTGEPLYALSSKLLFWQDDLQSCYSAGMISSPTAAGSAADTTRAKGSLSLLWPLFQTLCLSQFVDTLYSTIRGRQVMAETGMTVFEHSLAFAEAEAVVNHQLGLRPFGSSASPLLEGHGAAAKSAAAALADVKRSTILSWFDATPELLLVCVISSCSHVWSHILGMLNLQRRLRLWSTGMWGAGFMSILAWSLWNMASEPNNKLDLLRFPTVCIVSFVPHLLIVLGIGICASIYCLALVLVAFSPAVDEQGPRSFPDRIRLAREGLQANVHFSSFREQRHEDFFNALLRIGFTALTAASEAVFLNEGRPIGIRRWTWLEEERMREVELARAAPVGPGLSLSSDLGPTARGGAVAGGSATAGTAGAGVADGVGLADEAGSNSQRLRSGYAREKGLRKLKLGETGPGRVRADGVGASERSGRWMMAWQLFAGIARLVLGWCVLGVAKLLDMCGVQRRPRWMVRLLAGKDAAGDAAALGAAARARRATLDFWLLSDNGELSLPTDYNVDVEAEMRKRLRLAHGELTSRDEQQLDRDLYGWWKQGGWFGELDASGDYVPDEEDDDDDSSASSADSAAASVADSTVWESEEESRHARGGNRHRPHRQLSPRPGLTSDMTRLAQLLNPKTQEQRQEAQMLAYRLPRPMSLTRTQYSRSVERERARILTSGRRRRPCPPPSQQQQQLSSLSSTSAAVARQPFSSSSAAAAAAAAPSSSHLHHGPLTPEEESQLLEELILSRRGVTVGGAATEIAAAAASSSSTSSSYPQPYPYSSAHLPSSSSSSSSPSSSSLSRPPPPPPLSSSLSSSSSSDAQAWADGSVGGPQCVVCQTSARTILVWPCRCLSLCEDCRVALAMNNFSNCVCCRREVFGYSRIYVP